MHCASCGAPSVLGASRCPRCLAPFGAVGPMSGMVLAEEAPPPERPWGRWVGIGAVGVALLVGAGSWAMRRVRGTSVPDTVTAVRDSLEGQAAAPSPVAQDSVASDSAVAVVAPEVVASAPSQPTRPTATPLPTPASRPPAEARPPVAPAPSPAPSPAGRDTVYRATTWVWLRANPVNTSEQLAVVNPNQVVQVLERRFGWVRVRIDGREGWMSADYLERVP